MDRAHFLKLMALGTLGISLSSASFFEALAAPMPGASLPGIGAAGLGTRKLVLLELQGGNDGLNTLIPFASSHYYRLRPQLALPREKVLQLSNQQGLHPAMKALWPRWQKKQWAWVNNVGYPQPNRSHFRSIEIWESGSDANVYKKNGWLAETLITLPQRKLLTLDGILAKADTPGPLGGEKVRTLSTADVFRFARQAPSRSRNGSPTQITGNATLTHIATLNAQKENLNAALHNQLNGMQANFEKWRAAFPKSALGRELADVACCILAGLPTPVYKVSLKSFDTHRGQSRAHERLLTELSEALAVFANVLEAGGQWSNTLVMSYSEFGRRAAENGSGGTDHGTAAPHFALGGAVKGGLYGGAPDLSSIHSTRNDLEHHYDYRQLYRTVIEQWWKSPVPAEYRKYASIAFL
jgi:uncharacterized protein (DUF1501 family)